MEDIQIISATRTPNTALLQMADLMQYGVLLLLLCLLVYVGLISSFLKQLKASEPALWQSLGSPTLLNNNRALFALLFGQANRALPETLADKAKILRYLTYLIILMIVVLTVVLSFII